MPQASFFLWYRRLIRDAGMRIKNPSDSELEIVGGFLKQKGWIPNGFLFGSLFCSLDYIIFHTLEL